MSIDQINKVDLIGTDKISGDVILSIFDHLDWTESNSHLKILQEKINAYLRFIESGELYTNYPSAKDKNIIIEIVGNYELSDEAIKFIHKANSVIKDTGLVLRFNLHTIL